MRIREGVVRKIRGALLAVSCLLLVAGCGGGGGRPTSEPGSVQEGKAYASLQASMP